MIIHNVVCWGSHGKQENIATFPTKHHRNTGRSVGLYDTVKC